VVRVDRCGERRRLGDGEKVAKDGSGRAPTRRDNGDRPGRGGSQRAPLEAVVRVEADRDVRGRGEGNPPRLVRADGKQDGFGQRVPDEIRETAAVHRRHEPDLLGRRIREALEQLARAPTVVRGQRDEDPAAAGPHDGGRLDGGSDPSAT
jgi:hypothetical protein